MQRQTTIAKNNEIQRKWYVVDATDKPLGRLASQVAQVPGHKKLPVQFVYGEFDFNIKLEQKAQSQRSSGRIGNIVAFDLGCFCADSTRKFQVEMHHIKPDTCRVERSNRAFR